MRLVQIKEESEERLVAAIEGDGGEARRVTGVDSVRALAARAVSEDATLEETVRALGLGAAVDYPAALDGGRVLAPIDHPDSAHLLVSGTGLTHLGSADARDKMHTTVWGAEASSLSDSMKMFRLGLEGGKPAAGEIGVQPEWFYKGDGSAVVAPGAPLAMPSFALDGGEEPEVAGVYLIDPDGTPRRLGVALGNEFSDHVLERQNYLYLAHSKLRPCAVGPELLLGDLPADIQGRSRILRGQEVIWEKPFLSGEDNMSHTIANLEHHHFKYALFRRPGDVHLHYFGAATISFADDVEVREGDIFEIEAPDFGRPLRNPLARLPPDVPQVRRL